ncbi:NIPSNAP family containing protein [Ktedonospora formicarum]|uniref:NIPSNAP family containing protein n=1 Tax=Ktedonospora formicarum TaxID=2778364 RepID=A0A8J3I6F6_9CHLR|nr:NIPSNAP family containing protein [Ktedonospora formicarum]GHO47963.1 NIPSNAP family containing protein [Ktedonospora formicarum]
MRVIGQFRKRTDPDQFVWFRSFADMEARRQALEGFYYGPIWKAHRNEANDTMIDSDNVLLLKPARAGSGFQLDSQSRPNLSGPEVPGGICMVTMYTLKTSADEQFITFFEQSIIPALREAGSTIQGYFVTEDAANTFPALPVREGEHIFVWVASFASYDDYLSTLRVGSHRTTTLAPALSKWLAKPEEVLELLPTRRSLLRHH